MPRMREDSASARASSARLRVPLRRHAHALNQVECVLERKLLRLMVVRKFRQFARNKLDPTAIEERPVGSHRHEHRPAAVIQSPMTTSRIPNQVLAALLRQ